MGLRCRYRYFTALLTFRHHHRSLFETHLIGWLLRITIKPNKYIILIIFRLFPYYLPPKQHNGDDFRILLKKVISPRIVAFINRYCDSLHKTPSENSFENNTLKEYMRTSCLSIGVLTKILAL